MRIPPQTTQLLNSLPFTLPSCNSRLPDPINAHGRFPTRSILAFRRDIGGIRLASGACLAAVSADGHLGQHNSLGCELSLLGSLHVDFDDLAKDVDTASRVS